MEHSFWHDRWATNQIGFHQPAANPLLVTHCAALALPSAGRVLLPLCGKTLDIAWLLAAGYQVVGVELSELAVQQLFTELGATPHIQVLNDALQRYETDKLTVFVGDIFALSRAPLRAATRRNAASRPASPPTSRPASAAAADRGRGRDDVMEGDGARDDATGDLRLGARS